MSNIETITNYFDELYDQPKCALNYSNNYELLVAVVLSAQCTDKRVNIVTKELFAHANNPKDMLALGIDNLKRYIYSCGFYNAKAKSIMALSQDLIDRFDGIVPRTMNELISLKGVGRKTANVVLGVAFSEQAIAVDTHVLRISKRLGLTSSNSNPTTCEKDLMKLIPKNIWTRFHHQAIWFGREHCSSKNPKCSDCKLNNICKYYKGEK